MSRHKTLGELFIDRLAFATRTRRDDYEWTHEPCSGGDCGCAGFFSLLYKKDVVLSWDGDDGNPNETFGFCPDAEDFNWAKCDVMQIKFIEQGKSEREAIILAQGYDPKLDPREIEEDKYWEKRSKERKRRSIGRRL